MSAGPEYAFVTAAPFIKEGAPRTSPSAVARSRTLAPVSALIELGYDARAYSLRAEHDLAASLRDSKAIVLGDSLAGEDEGKWCYAELLAGIAAEKVLLLDFVAAPRPGTARFDSYASAFPRAAGLTAATQYVAAELGPLAKRRVEVIAEPHAGYPGEPRAARPRRRSRALEWLAARAGVAADAWRMRLLWIGEADGVASIIELAPQLQRLGREIPLALRCLCAAGSGLDALAEGLHEDDPDSLRLSIEAWSPMASAHALAACDLVLLPGQTPAHASRLIAALLAGRFPVCHPSPYYEALGEFAWVGNDLAEGIRWALSHPEDVLERLGRARDYVARVHAPAAAGRDWIGILLKIA
jgi:hypothetical protein